MIHVANVRTYRIADYYRSSHPLHTAYIGRSMPGRPGSPLANKYKLRYEAERAEILAKYEAWLSEQLKSDTEARREIQRLADLARDSDLVLLCWCAPKLCHGEPVKRAIEAKIAADGEAKIRRP